MTYGHLHAGWLPVHRDQLRAQRSVSSMGRLYLYLYYWYSLLVKLWLCHTAACVLWVAKRRPCNHACANKLSCAHDCCKVLPSPSSDTSYRPLQQPGGVSRLPPLLSWRRLSNAVEISTVPSLAKLLIILFVVTALKCFVLGIILRNKFEFMAFKNCVIIIIS